MKKRTGNFVIIITAFLVLIVLSLVALAYTTGLMDNEHVLVKDGIYLRIFGGQGVTVGKRTQDWLRKFVLKSLAVEELGWHEIRRSPHLRGNETWIFLDIANERSEERLNTRIWSEVPFRSGTGKISREAWNETHYFECALYFLAEVELEIKAVRKGESHTFLGTLARPEEEFPGEPGILSCAEADPDFVERKWCDKCERETIFYLCECDSSHCGRHWPRLIDIDISREQPASIFFYYFNQFFKWLGK